MIELSLILIRMLIDINSGPANAIGATFLAPAKNSTGIPALHLLPYWCGRSGISKRLLRAHRGLGYEAIFLTVRMRDSQN